MGGGFLRGKAGTRSPVPRPLTRVKEREEGRGDPFLELPPLKFSKNFLRLGPIFPKNFLPISAQMTMTEYRKILEQRINGLEKARYAPNVLPGSGSIHSSEWKEFRENQRKIKVLETALDELGLITSLD